MNDLMDRLREGLQEVARLAPALIAALLVFLAGYLLAKQVERWVDGVLKRMDFNRMAKEGGLAEAMDRARPHIDPVHAVGKLMFWLVMLVVILLASAALGLESINQMFGLMLAVHSHAHLRDRDRHPRHHRGRVRPGDHPGFRRRCRRGAHAGQARQGGGGAHRRLHGAAAGGCGGGHRHHRLLAHLGAVALAAGLASGWEPRRLAGEITRRWYEEGRKRGRRKTDPAAPNVRPTPSGVGQDRVVRFPGP